ncbi:MAG TPA: Gldg family protein, partial [Myxococcaceae bacterium]|nr:Gldg family protein [Myxococcaceae bacterium]
MNGANIGKIAGGIGLVLLLSSPFTWFLTSGSHWLGIAKLAIGVALVALYFATNWRRLGQFASRRSTFFFASTLIGTLLVLGALAAINFIAEKKSRSWDLTRNKIHSLAPQTVSTLKDLKEPVQAVAFVPTSDESYDELRDLLERYHREAPAKFDFSFKDPRKTPDLAAKYQLREGDTTVVLIRGEGAKQSHKAVQFPRFVPGSKEQELTNGLLALATTGEQKVYFLAGHGELPLELTEGAGSALTELVGSLKQEGYATEVLNVAGKKEVP